jgi:lysophospholipase
LLLLAGRGEYLEKYYETATDLTRRGFDVYSFDWRGQGLSTRMLPNRQKGHVDTYDDYLDDLDFFVETIMLPGAKAPYVILAHSMGGHIALRYLERRADVFEKVVLTAPLIDLAMHPVLKTILRAYVWTSVKSGLGNRYVPGAGDSRHPGQVFENNKLTSDRARFESIGRLLAESPDLALGGVTHQWLLATFRSVDRLRQKDFAERIHIPMLIVAAGNDEIVSVKAQKAIRNRLPQCRLEILEKARHEILVEADEFRDLFWTAFDAFISN